MSLIYLISSLPLLSFGAPPGISPDAFLLTCREQLGDADAAAAEALLNGRPLAHPFVEAWSDKETVLRNAVARQRARVAGTNAARWQRATRGCDSQIETGIEDAFQETDPVNKEKALDKVRWTIAEELAGPDPLSLSTVLAYAVKLAIVSRWQALDTARGQLVFDRLAEVSISSSTPKS